MTATSEQINRVKSFTSRVAEFGTAIELLEWLQQNDYLVPNKDVIELAESFIIGFATPAHKAAYKAMVKELG